MTPNIQVLTRTVAANGTVRIDVTGSNLLFASNTGAFNFSIDGGAFQAGFAILSFDVTQIPPQIGSVTPRPTTAPEFKSILLQDTSGAPNTITFIVSNYPVSYINPNATYFQKNAPTYPKCSDTTALADGATSAAFTGVDAGGQIRRTFILCNQSANILYLVDNSGKVGFAVPANQSYAVDSGGTFKVKNTAGSGASNYSVLEIFYQ